MTVLNPAKTVVVGLARSRQYRDRPRVEFGSFDGNSRPQSRRSVPCEDVGTARIL